MKKITRDYASKIFKEFEIEEIELEYPITPQELGAVIYILLDKKVSVPKISEKIGAKPSSVYAILRKKYRVKGMEWSEEVKEFYEENKNVKYVISELGKHYLSEIDKLLKMKNEKASRFTEVMKEFEEPRTLEGLKLHDLRNVMKMVKYGFIESY